MRTRDKTTLQSTRVSAEQSPGATTSKRRGGDVLSHLDVSAARHLRKVLLLLQGLVHLVVGHAKTAQSGFDGIQSLCEYDELGHIRNADDLPVQLRSEADRLLNLPAVD